MPDLVQTAPAPAGARLPGRELDSEERKDVICRLYSDGVAVGDITLAAGCSKAYVYKVLGQFDVPRRNSPEEDVRLRRNREIVDAADDEVPFDEIAEMYGLSVSWIEDIVAQRDRWYPPEPVVEEELVSVELTVIRIRGLVASGLSLYDVSLRSGVPMADLTRLLEQAPGGERVPASLWSSLCRVVPGPVRLDDSVSVSATILGRQLSLLKRGGWSIAEVARLAGLPVEELDALAEGAVTQVTLGYVRSVKQAAINLVRAAYAPDPNPYPACRPDYGFCVF